MKISYHGLSCFTVSYKGVKIVMDPFDPDYTGLNLPKLTADFLTISNEHKESSYREGVSGKDLRVFDWPGEYEARDVLVQGTPAYHFSKEDGEEDTGEVVLFTVRFEDLSFCHLGGLGHRMPSRLLDKIGDVDVLFVPVGGAGVINAKKAEEVVTQLEPKIAIPMHYNLPGLKEPEGLAGVEDFLKEVGVDKMEEQVGYEVKKGNLNSEKTEFVVLKPE